MNVTNRRIKVCVTGAAGQIGYALLFRIANGDMFGYTTEVELHMLELEPAMSALEGVAMELQDCAFPLLKNMVLTSDINVAMNGVNFAVLVGAVPRKAGMERADLLKINGGIFGAQGKAINDNAADDVHTIVVGNPCNTNCLIAMNNAPDVPNYQFSAMTMLDELRARTQMAIKANVDITEVSKMNIWGNHSATQYPDFYNAFISGKPAMDVIDDEQWMQNDFVKIIQQRGAQIIQARGASSAASAANAIVASGYNLVHDTVDHEFYSMCVASHGNYGVDEGLIFSFPCRTENGELVIQEGIEHNQFGAEKFAVTLDELRAERDAVKEMGLLG